MPDLFPVFEIPDEVEDADDAPPEYLPGYDYDFETRRLVLVGGDVARTSGYRAWVLRLIKAATTQRGAHPVYSDDFGCDLDLLPEARGRQESEATLQAIISDALLADPGTGAVYGFTFGWEGDSVLVDFTVEPAVGSPEQVRISLNAGGGG